MRPFLAGALVLTMCGMIAGCAVTTPRITEQDIKERIAVDREAMFKDQEPLKTPVSLEEAMARSIKYNLEHRIKIMEDGLALRQLSLMTYDMLPRLVAAAGYTERDSYNASSSMNISTGQESLAPSTSQDKGHFNSDLTLTWNILDFGVSYFQAKQQADRTHIMKERRRKVVHSIMQQVRQVYWLALGSQELEGRLEPLLKDVEKALQDSSNSEQEKLRPPIETLTYRKTLLEILKQLEGFRDELAQAKPRLASLMNLPLGQSFTVAPTALSTPKGPDALHYLEIRALLQRPELIEADYNERISVNETRKAIARMLPGIELSVGGHTDNNSFLVNQQWVEGGARLTWNLMNLISGPNQYKVATSQVEIAQAQRLALSVSILTQVHVAYQNFYSRKRQYMLSEQLQNIDSRIHEQTMNQAKSGSQNRLNEIRSATTALMAEYRSYQNYASLQSACGQIVATLGDDPLPETVTSHEVSALSDAIGARLNAPGALCSPMETVSTRVATPVVEAVMPDPEVPAQPVAVPHQPVVPTLSLSMNPDRITSGQTAKLAWASQNATKCEIQPGVGSVGPQGIIDVAPNTTTVYVVTCDSADGGKTGTSSLLIVAPSIAPVIPSQVPAAKLCSPAVLSLQFGSGRSVINRQHYAELKMLADFLKKYPEAKGEIAGHTDNVPYNKKNIDNVKLSKQRAENIKTYLVKTFGIDPNRITAKGHGPNNPVADNSTEEGRRKNRRITTNFNCE